MPAKKRPLALRIDPVLFERIDEARGDVSRTRFVERALEAALGDVLGPGRTGSPAGSTVAGSAASPQVAGVRSESAGSMVPPASVAAPVGSSPARPLDVFDAREAANEKQRRLNEMREKKR